MAPTMDNIPPQCPIDPTKLLEPPLRHEGWTLWREVYGTVIGTLPFLIGIMLAWGSLTERVKVLEVSHISFRDSVAAEHVSMRSSTELRDRQIEREREQIIKSLDRISVQIETLQNRAIK